MIRTKHINEFRIGQNIYGFYHSTFKEIKKGDLINIEIEQATINTVETVKRVMLARKV